MEARGMWGPVAALCQRDEPADQPPCAGAAGALSLPLTSE